MLLLVGVLDEEEQSLSGLAGPGNNGVSNLGLLAAKVVAEVGGGDGLLAEPEVLLREAEGAAALLASCLFGFCCISHSLLQTRRLVA